MKGYKVFNKDWTCRGFQYEVGKTYEMEKAPVCCDRGFHFCERLVDCFNYYIFNSKNKVAEVEALGKIDKGDNKSCTNKIKIVRELTWHEVLDLVNAGKDNTGKSNTGNCNTGNWNTGNYNTGNWNTGNYNTGDYNTGDWNSVDFSTGCFNTKTEKIRLFNKKSKWTYHDWIDSEARSVMSNCPYTKTIWIYSSGMADSEKEKHPTWECTGGYLKTIYVTKEDKQKWWDELDGTEREAVMSLPNFDKEIFKKITGIEVK